MAGPESQSDFRIFDRDAVRRHRHRAAAGFADFRFLLDHVAQGMAERLADTDRRFGRALDLGAHDGTLAAMMAPLCDRPVVVSDLSQGFVESLGGPRLVADEELLPFGEGTFDLIGSCLSLHWANDLPGVLVQARRALKPGGLFLAALLGGQTLRELRQVLGEAEAELLGGISPRVAPFADVRDVGDLLARAGFVMPVGDAETLTITYENAFGLMRDLRGMGETNALVERSRRIPPKSLLPRAAQLYGERFAGDDGRIPATFEVVYLTGWAAAG